MALVDLITSNRDLEDIMLRDYPGIIKEDMIDKRIFDEKTIYYFKRLDKDTLTEFLETNQEIKLLGIGLEDYIIKESRTFKYSFVKHKKIGYRNSNSLKNFESRTIL